MIDVLASSGIILTSPGVILASNSDGGGAGIAAILLLSGFIFYAYVFFRYRNSDKRHNHESETIAAMLDVEVVDERAGQIRGVNHARMRGANNRAVRGAQQSFGNAGFGEEQLRNITNSFFKK